MATVKLNDVKKVYPNGAEAVCGVSMAIENGEFIVFVGPSGCGKSTMLRMVAGLETITDGDIEIDSKVINNVSPADRDVAMVFQNYKFAIFNKNLSCQFSCCSKLVFADF